MAPEQVRGGRRIAEAIVRRGAIVYEMLGGRRAFGGPSAVETMHAIAANQPAKLPQVRPDVSERLALVVERTLEKNHERRFQTARALSSPSCEPSPRQAPAGLNADGCDELAWATGAWLPPSRLSASPWRGWSAFANSGRP